MIGAVAIPTYGRQELLWRCLTSVAALDPAPATAVVVDGNVPPLELGTGLPSWVHVIRESNRGPAHARNIAYQHAVEAGADIVCFLDDDAVAPPWWFGAHLAVHRRHPEAGAVGGGIANLTGGSLASDHLHSTAFAPLRNDAGPVRMVPSVNISYKRECIDDVGLFDASVEEPAGEDVDHCARVIEAGWSVWFEPGLTVGHHYPTSIGGLLRRQRLYGRGFVRSRRRHPDLPGAEFLELPWWHAIAGTVPHVARQAARARSLGFGHVPLEAACVTAFRTAALAERWRTEHPGGHR